MTAGVGRMFYAGRRLNPAKAKKSRGWVKDKVKKSTGFC
jgi:hypothetical protein